MSKRKRELGEASPTRRKAALEAASGVARAKPKAPAPVTGKSRQGRKGVVVYLDPLAKDLLRRIALEQDKSIQELGVEAINLLFRAYGEKPIG